MMIVNDSVFFARERVPKIKLVPLFCVTHIKNIITIIAKQLSLRQYDNFAEPLTDESLRRETPIHDSDH